MVIEAKPRRPRLAAPEYTPAGGTNGRTPPAPERQAPPEPQPAAPPTPSWREVIAFQAILLVAIAVLFGVLAFGFVARAGEAPAAAVAPAPSAAPASPTAVPSPTPAPVTAGRLAAPTIAAPVGARAAQTVQVTLEAREVVGLVDEGIGYTYWTFNGTVPGPMIRVRQGDTVEVTLSNAAENKTAHSIDLQAVTGPGGGGEVTMVAPGTSKTFRFQALHPGVFTYRSATNPQAQQIASGMYGLIVVEPPQGLPPVDREYYLMQGELYLEGKRDEHGLRTYSADKALAGQPDFILFNGGVGALSGDGAMKARTGESVRIFYGVGGPNLSGNLHLVGEVFDRVALTGVPLDDRARWATNVQSVAVPSGGAAVIEVQVQVPGRYSLLDNGISNALKGASGELIVEGPENPTVFTPQH